MSVPHTDEILRDAMALCLHGIEHLPRPRYEEKTEPVSRVVHVGDYMVLVVSKSKALLYDRPLYTRADLEAKSPELPK